jgi:hypothetical protein
MLLLPLSLSLLDLSLAFGGFTLCLGQRVQFLYFIGYVLLAHFFGLSTKFGHSIPRPLDLDNHGVKQPLNWSEITTLEGIIVTLVPNEEEFPHMCGQEDHASKKTWEGLGPTE